MSLVTTSELATHMRQATAPAGAQSLIDTAEDLIAAFLEIQSPASGRHPLAEHTVIERITPGIDRTTLEVSGGPINSVQSIYTVSGTTITSIGFNPFASGWTLGTRSSTGSIYEFQRGVEYVVEYRTGWATGTRVLYDFANETFETPATFDLLGWTAIEGGTGNTLANLTQAGRSRMRWTQTARIESILSPTISIAGSAYPFISLRFGLANTPTLSDWEIRVDWLASNGNAMYTENRTMKFNPPYRVTDAAGEPLSILQLDMTGDREGKASEEIQGLVQPIQPVHRWIDDTVTEFRVHLRSTIPTTTSIEGETLPVIDIDWIALSDGNSVVTQNIKRAILVTAASLTTAQPGVVSQRIGDYAVAFEPSEAKSILPSTARRILNPYRRPSW
tara:strand:+ start:146 stop:1315 length:1170 start_codon:yes stop_codon:yes gene_type:complete